MHDRLNDGWANVDDAWWTTEAAAIIERLVFQRDEAEAAQNTLKVERDEARRVACTLDSSLHMEHGNISPTRFGPMALAKQRGWDCFAALEETARESYKGGD
jgi:hypothetical protein